MMQRQPMFAGMQQALQAQGQQQQPRAAPPAQQPMWNGAQQNPWLQGLPGRGMAALRGMGQQLGMQAQNWGDPGQDAPVVRPPMNRGPNPMQAQQTQQMAQRYAQGLPKPGGQAQGLVNEEDPRFNGRY